MDSNQDRMQRWSPCAALLFVVLFYFLCVIFLPNVCVCLPETRMARITPIPYQLYDILKNRLTLSPLRSLEQLKAPFFFLALECSLSVRRLQARRQKPPNSVVPGTSIKVLPY